MSDWEFDVLHRFPGVILKRNGGDLRSEISTTIQRNHNIEPQLLQDYCTLQTTCTI